MQTVVATATEKGINKCENISKKSEECDESLLIAEDKTEWKCVCVWMGRRESERTRKLMIPFNKDIEAERTSNSKLLSEWNWPKINASPTEQ